jgi:cyanophycin synthetase
VNPLRSQARYRLQARADLVRAIGVGPAWRRGRADRRHRRVLLGRAPRVAEQMWREAAAELGAEVRELAPTLLEFSLNGAKTRIRGQTTPLADPVSTEVAENKALALRILAEAGLPVPSHAVLDAGAGELRTDVPAPWIVKPAGGAGGAGVTGEVRTEEQLGRALVHAWKYDSAAIVEQQAEGDTYRVLVLDGEILDVIRRRRPRITGDGRSTIEELIFAEYARRIASEGPSGLKHLAVDLDCLFTLERGGRTPRSVLADGESAVIKTATNYNGPEETETLDGPAPPGLADASRIAAGALGVRLAGVDIVTTDPARPVAETGGVVLEANPVPGLTHHYNVADSAGATRIAVPILRALLT